MMEYVILALAGLAALMGAGWWSSNRRRQSDVRDAIKAADMRLKAARDRNAAERKAVEGEARRADTRIHEAIETGDEARHSTASAREQAERIAGKYPKVPAVLLAVAAACGVGWADAPPSCVPPDVTGIVHALRDNGGELEADAAFLVEALREMAASSCRESVALRGALAHLEASRALQVRLTGIAEADARDAREALESYRGAVPRLKERRFGWTAGIGAGLQADADEVEVGAFVGLMWGIRL